MRPPPKASPQEQGQQGKQGLGLPVLGEAPLPRSFVSSLHLGTPAPEICIIQPGRGQGQQAVPAPGVDAQIRVLEMAAPFPLLPSETRQGALLYQGKGIQVAYPSPLSTPQTEPTSNICAIRPQTRGA